MKKIVVASILMLSAALFAKYTGEVSLDKKDGFYRCGETASCTVMLKKDGKPLTGAKARLIVKKEGRVIGSEDFITDGKARVFTGKLDAPGWLYFGFEVLDENGKALKGKDVYKHKAKPSIVTEIGAIFDADKLLPAVKEPEDFDAFWASRRAELDKIPLEPKLTELPSKEKNVKLYAVEVKCLGSRPVTGYLAVPTGDVNGKCPAVVEFLSMVSDDVNPSVPVSRAKNGTLAFYASWHGLPTGQKKDFYVKNIRAVSHYKDIVDREKWVMGEMYYRVMRALDFVKTRPEWDRKNLVAVGGSLGGAQSAAAAALDKDVTLALVGVPTFAEMDNRKSGRSGHRMLVRRKGVKKGDMRPYTTAAYYDIVNFAMRTKCEVFVCTGFTDETCPPSNVFTYYNALTCKKNMSTNPFTGHFGTTKNIKGNKKLEELVGSITVYNYRIHK